ncbi:MAG: SAM-dependent methyltransferase [Candidatus Gastranaerophilaceae bacterium]
MEQKVKSSFRDPSGYVYEENGKIYRKINEQYLDTYNCLMKSGLYEELLAQELIIPHKEMDFNVIKPNMVFISYPYEWSFSQLKDAALATLKIQQTALKFGMSLKDASAYNIQFYNGKPVLIDTLSFEKYTEGSMWVAYKQYCQHFLAPLALMSYVDLRLSSLLKNYIDGIPLDLASNLLPWKSKLNFGILTNIHIHAKSQIKHQSDARGVQGSITKFQFEALIDSLFSCTSKLKPKTQSTEWENYYTFTNYDDESFQQKKDIVSEFIEKIKPQKIWDLGGNIGIFSRIASDKDINTVSFDIDPLAIEKSYLTVKEQGEKKILPLILDLTNPSPSIGFANEERDNIVLRAKNVDCIMALAIIHHLAISNNLPLEKVAEYFSRMSKNLIIEFVPKEDSQVQILLATREDIFPNYNVEGFEQAFSDYYNIKEKQPIEGTQRILYLMELK